MSNPIKIKYSYPRHIPPFPEAAVENPIVILTVPGRIHVCNAQNELEFDVFDKNLYSDAIRQHDYRALVSLSTSYALYGMIQQDDTGCHLGIFNVYNVDRERWLTYDVMIKTFGNMVPILKNGILNGRNQQELTNGSPAVIQSLNIGE